MVQILMIIVKMAWLTTSYSIIFGYLSSALPALVITLSDVPYWEEILKYITAAVSTIKWILSPGLFTFGLYFWLTLPLMKIAFYFTHKAAYFGDLSAFSLRSEEKPEDTRYKRTEIGFQANIK